jgi:glycosyltransferase involved in cell wall biosynthesis
MPFPCIGNENRRFGTEEEFDLLICDFLQPALNFRHVMEYFTLLFQHNVESRVVKRGGTRIKVYEAMAMGKAIVSTRVGVEGLQIEHATHVLLADQPQEFSESVIHLFRNPMVRDQLGRSAREFVESGRGWNQAVTRFVEICLQVVHSRQERLQIH